MKKEKQLVEDTLTSGETRRASVSCPFGKVTDIMCESTSRVPNRLATLIISFYKQTLI